MPFLSSPPWCLSVAFAAVTFSAFYLSAKLHAFTSNGHFFRLIPSLVLLACACAVAVNRIDDYVASALDAFAGAIVGMGGCLCILDSALYCDL